MRWTFGRGKRVVVSGVVVLASLPAAAFAQDVACPIVDTGVVSQAIGSPVRGGVMLDPISNTPLDTGPSLTVCMFDSDDDSSITVTRENNAFGPGGAIGPADLALRQMRLPDEARAEIDALRQNGITSIQLPTFQMTPASGLGDAAVWVFQTEPSLLLNSGGYFVQRGPDALVFAVAGPDEASARTQATALAQRVLASVP